MLQMGDAESFGPVALYDATGRLVSRLEVQKGKLQLPKQMAPGLYLLKTGEGRLARLTVIK